MNRFDGFFRFLDDSLAPFYFMADRTSALIKENMLRLFVIATALSSMILIAAEMDLDLLVNIVFAGFATLEARNHWQNWNAAQRMCFKGCMTLLVLGVFMSPATADVLQWIEEIVIIIGALLVDYKIRMAAEHDGETVVEVAESGNLSD